METTTMKRTTAGAAGAVLLALFLCLTPGAALADHVTWNGFEDGKKQAGDAGKKMLVYFRTPWCGYCAQMEKTTFSDKQVVAFIREKFVPVKVNADAKKALAAAYMVEGYPTIWFLTPEGEKIRVLPQYVPARPFLQVLQYIDSESYETMSFPDFVKQND
jgi:thioredoxin-related protein